jgi:hypothetical protein
MSVLDLRCTRRRRPGTVVAGVGLPHGGEPGQRGPRRARDGSGLAIDQSRVGGAGPGGVEVLRHSEPVPGCFERGGMLGLGRINGWRQRAGSLRTWFVEWGVARCAGRGPRGGQRSGSAWRSFFLSIVLARAGAAWLSALLSPAFHPRDTPATTQSGPSGYLDEEHPRSWP